MDRTALLVPSVRICVLLGITARTRPPRLPARLVLIVPVVFNRQLLALLESIALLVLLRLRIVRLEIIVPMGPSSFNAVLDRTVLKGRRLIPLARPETIALTPRRLFLA